MSKTRRKIHGEQMSKALENGEKKSYKAVVIIKLKYKNI